MAISFSSHANVNWVIATEFCTWHHSCPVMACAREFSDLIAGNQITTNIFFCCTWCIWNTTKNHFWNGPMFWCNLCIVNIWNALKCQQMQLSIMYDIVWSRKNLFKIIMLNKLRNIMHDLVVSAVPADGAGPSAGTVMTNCSSHICFTGQALEVSRKEYQAGELTLLFHYVVVKEFITVWGILTSLWDWNQCSV